MVTSSRRLATRSTTTPAGTEKSSTGANWSALLMPSLNAEFVSSRTSHACPTRCIHVPINDTICPLQKTRKSRWLNARRPIGKGIALHHGTTTKGHVALRPRQ